MRGKKRNWIIVMLGVLALLLVLGPTVSGQAAEKKIKIGSIMPISGPLSVVGMAWTRGWELFFDKINEQGGIKVGHDRYLVDFIAEDSKLSPDAAATAARKLVHRDGAKYVFGAILDQSAEAIYQICAPAKVLHMISWINVPGHPGDVSPKKAFAVRPCISADDAVANDYAYLKKAYPHVKTVAISVSDTGYEEVVKRNAAKAKRVGIELIGVEKWQIGITDFLPTYTKLLAYKPDAIHCMTSAQAMYQLKAARQLGFKGPFFSDSPLGPDVILRVAGTQASHDVFCNGMDLGAATDDMKDVMNRWLAKYKEEFVSDALLAWDESWILVQAIEKAQSVDPIKVLEALNGMTEPGSLQTVFGPAHLSGAQRFGVNRVLVRPIPISRLMNGKIKFVGLQMP